MDNVSIDPKAHAIDVGALRRRLGLSQRHFAGAFGLSVGTLRHWERGSRRPTGTALVLLHVIAINPRAVRVAVLKARAARRDVFPAIESPQTCRAGPGFRVPV